MDKTGGQMLKDGREAKRVNVHQVSIATGFTVDYIRDLESGKNTKPTAHALWKLADLYQIELKELSIAFGLIIKKHKIMNKTKTGVELIATERQEQKDKHGFTDEYQAAHPEYYSQHELMSAARYCLTLEGWPENWNEEFSEKIAFKTLIGRLTVAGALIAAEIDRLNAQTPHP